ncbi:MAG TPA: hypothetical protein VLY24_23220 [Bryobacteraceae bacterium]|nr:hypothetical protein [Bryobacteraceae bacterium]
MATRTQEQALRIYYAAMPDGELQHAAANKDSFLPIAQRLLGEELRRRHLEAESAQPAHLAHHGLLQGLRHAFRH